MRFFFLWYITTHTRISRDRIRTLSLKLLWSVSLFVAITDETRKLVLKIGFEEGLGMKFFYTQINYIFWIIFDRLFHTSFDLAYSKRNVTTSSEKNANLPRERVRVSLILWSGLTMIFATSSKMKFLLFVLFSWQAFSFQNSHCSLKTASNAVSRFLPEALFLHMNDLYKASDLLSICLVFLSFFDD